MKRRWIKLRHVDAALPLSKDQRREVIIRSNAHAGGKAFMTLKLAALSVILLGGGVGGALPLMWWLARVVPLHPVVAILGYVLVAGLCSLLFAHTVWRWFAQPTRMALRDLGFDVCIKCGYWLRGLSNGAERCPECGAARETTEEAAP